MKRPRSATAEIVLAVVGASLFAVAVAANQAWLDRHFLPSFVIDRRWYVRIETTVRALVAGTGILLAVFARRRVARRLIERPGETIQIAIAVVLALLASEAALRRFSLRPGEWLLAAEEPRPRPDVLLGWTLVPHRVGHLIVGGRSIEYAVNAQGYRARSPEEAVDFARPTVVFSGESIIFGEGLTWDESIPAQTGAMLGVQTANLGVSAYSTDQAFLRLRQELPRFRHPTAVISIFMPTLFGRNLDDDRPHLSQGLTWMPAARHARLMSLARLFVPYRSEEQVTRGVAMTRGVLRATVSLARACGAVAVIVVPQIGSEGPDEAAIRRRVLDDGNIPYILVPLDERWTIGRFDRHPDARGARAIAVAIAATCESLRSCR